jgi:catechol 2,3-dioxygenase-like lactoylglutathione lyase family enzyme
MAEHMLPRIQHVSIPIHPGGTEAARDFYGDLLQLTEIAVPRSVSSLDLLWYRLGDTELHLFAEEIQADRSARHFCIEVADLEALRVRLEAAGVPMVGATPLPGRPRHFCRDPFGNLIELTAIEPEEPIAGNE